jgi:hypothetical protein
MTVLAAGGRSRLRGIRASAAAGKLLEMLGQNTGRPAPDVRAAAHG